MCLSLLRLKQQLIYLDPYSSFVSDYWVSHFCTNSRYAYWALRINEWESSRYLCNEVTSPSPTTINQLFALPGHIRIVLISTSLFSNLLLWTTGWYQLRRALPSGWVACGWAFVFRWERFQLHLLLFDLKLQLPPHLAFLPINGYNWNWMGLIKT